MALIIKARTFILLFVLLTIDTYSISRSSRDYWYCSEDLDPEIDNFLYQDRPFDSKTTDCIGSRSTSFCLKHCIGADFINIDDHLLSFIPSTNQQCHKCNEGAIYFGYLDPRFKRYSAHLIRHLRYTSQHPECSCYWPELSSYASEISEHAYELFGILFETTALASLVENDKLCEKFRNTALSDCNFNTQIVFCIARQFRFSHYHRLTSDLAALASEHFEEHESAEILQNLQTILKSLALSFVPLYESCLEQHPNKEIQAELEFTKLFLPNLDDNEWELEIQEFYDKVTTIDDYLFQMRFPKKEERLPALNILPLFHVKLEDISSLPGKDEACAKLLKNLINTLYSGKKFYEELKKINPELEDRFVQKLTDEANKRKKSDLTRTKDLATLELEDEHLSYLRYKIFRDSYYRYWNRTEKLSTDSYYSLLEFITMAYDSSYLASIWLAPDPLLMAIFQDADVVRDVIETRQEIYGLLKDGDDRLAAQDILRRKFSDKLDGINPIFIDFRINTQEPHSKLVE